MDYNFLTVLAHTDTDGLEEFGGHHMMDWNVASGGMLIWIVLLFLIIIAGLVVLGFVIYSLLNVNKKEGTNLLKERLAKGEIDLEEYKRILKEL